MQRRCVVAISYLHLSCLTRFLPLVPRHQKGQGGGAPEEGQVGVMRLVTCFSVVCRLALHTAYHHPRKSCFATVSYAYARSFLSPLLMNTMCMRNVLGTFSRLGELFGAF